MTRRSKVALAILTLVVLAHVLWLATGGSATGPIVLAILVATAVLAVTAGRFRWYNALFRIIIGLELLGSVADRFGLLGAPGSPSVSWGSFDEFTTYVGDLLPAAVDAGVTPVAIGATVAELTIGILLIVGVFRPQVTFAAGVMLSVFALAMVTSVGVSDMLAYAVTAQAAAMFFLADRYTTASSKRRVSVTTPAGSTVQWP